MASAATSRASRRGPGVALEGGGTGFGRDPEVVQLDAVEAGRQLADGGVAPLADGGQDGLHSGHRLGAVGRRARQDGQQVALDTSQIESGEHRSEATGRPSPPRRL